MLYENPELYDALLPVSRDQSNFYTALARSQAGPVLALACGSGQISVPIAEMGLPVTGLDNSPEMLEAAQQRALAASAQVEFIEGDMREFDLGRKFSLIFVARNSLLHLSEQREFYALFSAVRRHLSAEGIFAFDIFNPDVRILSQPNTKRVPVMRKATQLHGEISIESTNDYDTRSQVNRATWFISTTAKRDAWVVPLHLRSIFPQELLSLVATNGFRLTRRDGDYAGGDFTSASANQVCRCRPV